LKLGLAPSTDSNQAVIAAAETDVGGSMASYTWNGVSGFWNLASYWTPSGVPTASDSATINGSTTTTITVDTADVADSLTLSNPNATLTLNDDGSLTIGGTLTMSNGSLNDAGVLSVGALNLSGGALTIN
jgi:phage baseplate assembly protein gpV